jgi:Fe-S cluster assembly protein SufD
MAGDRSGSGGSMTSTGAALASSGLQAAFEESAGSGPAWLSALRLRAFERFQAQGLPTTRDEDWKYTNPAALLRTPIVSPASLGPVAATLEDLKPLGFGSLGVHRAVFVNGRFSPALSSLASLPPGLEVVSLRELLLNDPDRVRPYLEGRDGPGAFGALGAAFLDDGAFVFAEAGFSMREGLLLFFYSANLAGDAPLCNVRNVVALERGSQLSLVEAYAGPEGQTYVANAQTDLHVGEGAAVERLKLQRESTGAFHVGRVSASLGRRGRLNDLSLSLGGALARSDVDVLFDGEGGECALDGLFMARGRQQVDVHTRVDHARPHCSSRQLYKGILDGKARGVFHGRVLVRKDAQKSDALQSNRNLLLSHEALVNSIPQLEIHADDVKCKHGSATGQLDPAALFYLRARGLAELEARSLLTYAFASDLLQRVKDDQVRLGLEAYLQSWLAGSDTAREAAA